MASSTRLSSSTDSPRISDSGFPFQIGPAEGAMARVGMMSPPQRGDVTVNAAQVQLQAAVVEDGNASYWDEDFARAHWGGLLSPPGMLQLWSLPLPWTPRTGPHLFCGASTQATLPGPWPLLVSTDSEYFEPVLEGDRLTQTETLLEVKPATSEAWGAGHMLTFQSDYTNQHDVLVARVIHTLLRYGGEPAAAAAAAPVARVASLDSPLAVVA